MRSGDSKKAGFSVELMVSNLQETVCKLSGAVQGQNPARKFKVLQSIVQRICRILPQAQKQMNLTFNPLHLSQPVPSSSTAILPVP
jgi:hypothetical protein